MDQKEKKPLQVVDKRHFTKEGEWRESPMREPAAEVTPPPSDAAGTAAAQEPPQPGQRNAPLGPSPFTEFVLNLASSALISLGQLPNPMTNKPEVDLQAAASIIDVLDMLEEKTRGNLDSNERHILQDMLTQLHLAFAQVGRKHKP